MQYKKLFQPRNFFTTPLRDNCFMNISSFNSSDFRSERFSNSVHFTLNNIRTWDSKTQFFLTVQILRIFTTKQICKLKNIFFEFLNDPYIWTELEKMIDSGNISFASKKVYKSLSLLDHSPLSRLLLEIYFLELDRFFAQFSADFNITKNLFSSDKKKSESVYPISPTTYLPIKFEHLLQSNNTSLNIYNKGKFNMLKASYFKQITLFSRLFSKKVNYTRYLDHILIGLITSKHIAFHLEKKLFSFIRSNLSLDIRFISTFTSSDYSILFLGFQIRLISTKPNYNAFSSLRNNKKYLKRLFARTELYQKLWILEFYY